ncbi:30S ribosomal protein S17 [Gammaproteobacteria bacterium]|jgi:small subunit ribosomal protein S17|nr:30S ribosomal protein S17 [Gammaproteobacteria bacterium]|tara:strand:+ start:599 stop:865 length:267 start_codon:yes stop_codon:yes gene_type:complete
MSIESTQAKTVTGTVKSNKMDKTISVLVERRVRHPLYGKFMRRSTKLLAHDETNECNEGDIVVIEASRPLSKNKSWRLQRIVSKAQVV